MIQTNVVGGTSQDLVLVPFQYNYNLTICRVQALLVWLSFGFKLFRKTKFTSHVILTLMSSVRHSWRRKIAKRRLKNMGTKNKDSGARWVTFEAEAQTENECLATECHLALAGTFMYEASPCTNWLCHLWPNRNGGSPFSAGEPSLGDNEVSHNYVIFILWDDIRSYLLPKIYYILY